MNRPGRPFGWALSLDIWDCDRELLADGTHIEKFLVELCDDVLGMSRFGPPLIERFALHNPDVAGYSAVQLIETSSVVCHFAEHPRSVYVDVFSCREYDADAVLAFCEKSFGGHCSNSQMLIRQLPGEGDSSK